MRALAFAGVAAAAALGCTPKIGDSCTVSTNCSATGDRLCDTTQPGGYCTVFNCEPGTCPEDSVCINFGTTLSSVGAGECSLAQGTSPYQRSFCMASCGSDGDCRSGGDYSCQVLKGDAAHPNDLGAVLAETTGDGKVCARVAHAAPQLADGAGGDAGDSGVAGGGGYLGVATGVCIGYPGGASNGDAGEAGAND